MTPIRLTIWIDELPPLVIDRGLTGEYVRREAQGELIAVGTTPGGGLQIGADFSQRYTYTIEGLVLEEQRAILSAIKIRQRNTRNPVSFRDELQRINVEEIDGFASRQRLVGAEFPDAQQAFGSIIMSHYESTGYIEISDRFETSAGYNGQTNVSELSFRLVEVV